MTSNLRRLPRPTRQPGEHLEILQAMDNLLADIALDNPDLEAGYHQAISLIRQRYRHWLNRYNGHPSTGDTA